MTDTAGPAAEEPGSQRAPAPEQLMELLDSITDSVTIYDREWRIRYANARASEITGLSREQLVGHVLWDLFPEARETGFYPAFQRALHEQTPVVVEEYFPPFDKWFETRVFPSEHGLTIYSQDITERKRAEAALHAQSALTRTITDNAASCLFMMDANGHPTFMNPAAEEVTGYTLDEIKSRPLHYAVHYKRPDGSPYPMEDCPIDRANVELVQMRNQEEIFVDKFGRLFPVQYSVAPIERDGNTVGAVIEFRDITEQKRAEEALREQSQLAALDAEVGVILNRSESLQEILQHCCEALVRHLDAAFARCWTLNHAENMLELRASAGMYTHTDGPHGRVPVGKFKIGLIAEERKPHLTNQVVGDPRVGDQEWAKREGMVAFAGYPLLIEDDLVGVLAMFARHELSDRAMHAMRSVANGVALGVRRKRAEEERNRLLEERRVEADRLKRLAEAAVAINSVLTLDELLALITEKAREIIGTHQSVTSMTVNDDLAQAIYSVSLSDKYAAWRDYATTPDGTGIYRLVCDTNHAMRMTQEELERHPAWRGFGEHAAEHPPMRGWLAVPLRTREGRNLGLIQLSDKYDGEFTDQDESILVQLAQLASVALENQRLLAGEQQARAEAERTAAALDRINAVGQALAAELELDSLVQVLTDEATRLTGAQFGAYFYNVVNQQGESYMLYTLSGVPREHFEKFPMPRNTTIFAPTFAGEGIVRLDDVTKDPRYGKNPPYSGMPEGHLPVRSYLAVPVVSRSGEVLGGLFFGHSQPGVFTEHHERVLAGISAQAAVAIDNARLYSEVRKLNATLERRVVERTAQLQRMNQELESFSYSVSHDLRAPIRHISGFAEMLQKRTAGALDEQAQRQLRIIIDTARQAGSMIDDLLSFSRMGRADLRETLVDMNEVVRDVRRDVAPDTGGRAVEWSVGRLPVVKADPAMLRLVVRNLIDNALKFTSTRSEARIEIDCREEPGEYVIVVRDNGVGFDPRYTDKLFGVFHRLHREHEFEGTGIGLANVRRIVERHGGKTWAESEPGSGATFYFTLPRTGEEN